MKTPEEIKNGLIHCSEIGCVGCPYHDEDCSPHNPFQKCADDALMLIRQLENQIADLGKKVPRWINVKERLPKDGQKVIAAFRDGGGVIVDQARYSNGEFDFANWAYVWHENITHWTPLPEPPKEEQHD